MINLIKKHLVMKVFLLATILLLFISGITYGFIEYYMPKTYLTEMNKSLDHAVRNLCETLSTKSKDECQTVLQDFCTEYNVAINLYDNKGNKINIDTNVEFSVSGSSQHDKSKDSSNSNGITKTCQILFKGDSDTYSLKILGTREALNETMYALQKILPKLCIVIVVASLIIAFLFAGYVAYPALKINKIARDLANLDFSVNCPVNRTDELGTLANSINELAKRMDQSLGELEKANKCLQEDVNNEKELEEQQLIFFSAVSHELQTPITVLKGEVEGMIYQVGGYKDRDKYLRRVHEIIMSMEGLVQEILGVTRLKKIETLNVIPFNLSQLVRQLINEYEELSSQKNIVIKNDLQDDLQICGEIDSMKKAISNLISNAIRYTPAGNRIFIYSEETSENKSFNIENEGVHVPEDEIPKLFDAFYRLDRSRSKKTGGSGLGLYIVQLVLERHGFPYKFENTDQGVRIQFIFHQKTS